MATDEKQSGRPLTADAAIDLVLEELNAAAAEQLRVLLERKHLYQRVSLEAERIVCDTRARVILSSHLDGFDAWANEFLQKGRLIPAKQLLRLVSRSGATLPEITLVLRNVKLFCSDCDDRETFSPVWWADVTNELRKPHLREVIDTADDSIPAANLQLFTLTYQCQHCKGAPLAFLVRREGWQLMLDGRSPMEQIEVPPFVPKPERHLYRDAIIAIHGGKPLAALFYLRTFIEQFARRVTGLTGKSTGEQIMTKYNDTLPPEHRGHMPSLREWYDQLSGPLHEARDDATLFEQAKKEIDHHFDIRRVFGIPERRPTAGSGE